MLLLFCPFVQAATLKILKPKPGEKVVVGQKVVAEWEIQGLPQKTDSLVLSISGYPNNLYPKNGLASYTWQERLPEKFDIFKDTEKKRTVRMELKNLSMADCGPNTDCEPLTTMLAESEVEILVSLPDAKNPKGCPDWGNQPKTRLIRPHKTRGFGCDRVFHVSDDGKNPNPEKICPKDKHGQPAFRYLLCLDGRWY